jgi:hypothetical protein
MSEKKSNLSHLHKKLIGFYNRDEKCLQHGTDWAFKLSSLSSIFLKVNLITSWNQIVNFMPNLLYPLQRMDPGTKLNRRMGRHQSWPTHFGEQKHFLLLLEFEPWTIQPVISHCTYGLSYPDS